jgi:NitT/TauT family transport system ATP-binding protein
MAAGDIIVRGLGKSYGTGRRRREIIRDCSFAVPRNRLTVMIGPSGVGKSTLIRLIAGFEAPDAGEILIDGAAVTGPGPDRLVVFQENALFPWMTTSGNILYGPEARGEDRRDSRKALAALLDKVGLRRFAGKYPGQLSGGMQRRAELARAMINNPAVMILDEPFRGLDSLTRRLMLDYYAGLSLEEGRTTLFVTTDIDEALFLADRLLIMSHLPTRVRSVIEIAEPRPRVLDRTSAVKAEVLRLLHEEGMKAFF